MRILAILFNLLLLGEVIYLLSKENIDGKVLLLIIPITLAPIFSLIAIFQGENWLSLYFKRRALEEKQKIDQLSENE